MSQNIPQNVSGSLMPAPVEGESIPVDQQPRQPHNLQGLLRFAMEATEQEDAPNDSDCLPLDEERKKFLENALKSMTVDVVETLQKSINLLLKTDKLKMEDDISKYLEAFETILDYVDVIDTAVDFHKIGGFRIFPPCLTSSIPQIRSQACVVLGECTQNNPYCQQVVIDTDLLEHLLSILDRDQENSVKVKALFAISCSVRENPEAINNFKQLKGVESVIRALKGPENLSGKAAFLLGRLSSNHVQIRDLLIRLNIIPILCQLISKPRTSAHEHLLALLWSLVENNQLGLDYCTQTELQLTNILKNHLKVIGDNDEFLEEQEYCQNLLQKIQEILPEMPETDR